MSMFIKIPGVNPPTTRPRVDLVDSAAPEAGALYLYDATHPGGQWGSGVAAGLSIPNVVATSAAKLTGDPLHGSLTKGGTTITAKRSSKGGIHLTLPDAVVGAGEYISMSVPAALAAYIHANPTHSYYMSKWSRTTRVATGGGTPAFISTIHSSSSSFLGTIYHANTGVVGTYPQPALGGDKLLGARTSYTPPTLGTPAVSTLGVSGWYGTVPASASTIRVIPFQAGNSGGVGPQIISPNMTVYRAYLEDLTVSKRTYAQADAADNALFTELCMTAGGRYYGDTV